MLPARRAPPDRASKSRSRKLPHPRRFPRPSSSARWSKRIPEPPHLVQPDLEPSDLPGRQGWSTSKLPLQRAESARAMSSSLASFLRLACGAAHRPIRRFGTYRSIGRNASHFAVVSFSRPIPLELSTQTHGVAGPLGPSPSLTAFSRINSCPPARVLVSSAASSARARVSCPVANSCELRLRDNSAS